MAHSSNSLWSCMSMTSWPPMSTGDTAWNTARHTLPASGMLLSPVTGLLFKVQCETYPNGDQSRGSDDCPQHYQKLMLWMGGEKAMRVCNTAIDRVAASMICRQANTGIFTRTVSPTCGILMVRSIWHSRIPAKIADTFGPSRLERPMWSSAWLRSASCWVTPWHVDYRKRHVLGL